MNENYLSLIDDVRKTPQPVTGGKSICLKSYDEDEGVLVMRDIFTKVCADFWLRYKRLIRDNDRDIILPSGISGNPISPVPIELFVRHLYHTSLFDSPDMITTCDPLHLLQLANLADFFCLEKLRNTIFLVVEFRILVPSTLPLLQTEDIFDLVFYIENLYDEHPNLWKTCFIVIPMLFHWLTTESQFSSDDIARVINRSQCLEQYKRNLEAVSSSEAIHNEESNSIFSNII